VKSKDTSAEIEIRRITWGLGFRYKLHRRDLHGVPDLVFSGKRKLIFVHGCFWHGHDCARGSRVPKSNREYWVAKIARNKARDSANQEALRKDGWEIMIVWECEIKNKAVVSENIHRFLANTTPNRVRACVSRRI
jgi:DNA mismatch endonuclease (patch repair protein)